MLKVPSGSTITANAIETYLEVKWKVALDEIAGVSLRPDSGSYIYGKGLSGADGS